MDGEQGPAEALRRASLFLHQRPWHRQEIFRAGFARHGFKINENGALPDPGPGDVLLLWNRNVYENAIAKRYEALGATVLITENGYIGTDEKGGKLLALAKSHHNGAGTWRIGQGERKCTGLFSFKPWRETGSFILVLPQRGIGEPGVAMPSGWANNTMRMLRTMTKREIRLRAHPGRAKTEPYDDLRGAWAAVTWGSGAAIKALYAGVPVFYDLRPWIGGQAAIHLQGADLERPFTGDRLPMFQRLAWAQWSARELEDGTALAHLLEL